MHFHVIDFFRLRHALDHQNHRATDRGNIDRFKCRVQDEDRLLHDRRLSSNRGYGAWWALLTPRFRQGARSERPTTLAKCFHIPILWYYTGASGVINCGSARATVRPATRDAPARLRAREQASSVAPVVNTSSTSKTRSLSTWALSRVA